MEVYRAWSPFGVDRFYYLVRRGFYDDTRFFRVVPGYIAQFGISGDPQITSAWRQSPRRHARKRDSFQSPSSLQVILRSLAGLEEIRANLARQLSLLVHANDVRRAGGVTA